jgi:hypothetical protein
MAFEKKNGYFYIMNVTKLILFVLLGSFIVFSSCKKPDEPQAGTCSDGFLNNGELGIDCGGPCPPCEEYDASTFFASFNNEVVFFSNPSALYGDTIFISASNDSIQLFLRFKNLTEADESGQFWPFLMDGQAYMVYNGLNYTELDQENSSLIVTEKSINRISGLFQMYLPYGPDNLDTLKIINGTFYKVFF